MKTANSIAYTHLQSTGVKWCIWRTQHPWFLLWSLFWHCRSSRNAGIRRTQSGLVHQWRRLNGGFSFRCHSLKKKMIWHSKVVRFLHQLFWWQLKDDYPAMKYFSRTCGGEEDVILKMLAGTWQVRRKEKRCRRMRDEKLSGGIKIDSGSCVWLQSHAFKLGQNCSCVREKSGSVLSFSAISTL